MNPLPESLVTTARDGAVLTITLNRPQARNALNAALLEQLQSALGQASEDHEVRCIRLTAHGSVFCAGGDLKEIFANPTPLSIKQVLDNKIRPVLKTMLSIGKPIVTALNGPVAGAGIGIALASDIIIASEDAAFVTAFGKVGAMPDSAVMYLMVQNIGMLRAKDIVFRNRTLSATEAAAMGLYTHVVPSSEVMSASRTIAGEVANGPTMALGLAKSALREAPRLSFDAFMDLESLSMALLNTTSDQREGILAFSEKRDPVFTGH